jgi:oligoribonuclease (3'-5' exoribonuclease)
MKELFLDLETSGTDPSRHSILSIGIVISLNGLEDYQSFYREIKYGELLVAPEAIAINGLEFADQTDRIPLAQVDEEAVIFIKKYYQKDFKPMAIGLNIGVFDLQFIQRHMPFLANRISHRSVDLNSLIYVLAEKHSRDVKEMKQELSDRAFQNTVQLALGVDKHNALFDAVFNLNLYSIIKHEF